MRLVLNAAGSGPVRIPVRRERIDAGVAAMNHEEVLCWYARTLNGNPARSAYGPYARSWQPSGVDQMIARYLPVYQTRNIMWLGTDWVTLTRKA